jgi:hypothetical protein
MVPAKSARSRPALRSRNIDDSARPPLLMEAALWHGSEAPIDCGGQPARDYTMQQVPSAMNLTTPARSPYSVFPPTMDGRPSG